MDMGLPEPELSGSSSELDDAANDILKANASGEGLDEFSGLEAAAVMNPIRISGILIT